MTLGQRKSLVIQPAEEVVGEEGVFGEVGVLDVVGGDGVGGPLAADFGDEFLPLEVGAVQLLADGQVVQLQTAFVHQGKEEVADLAEGALRRHQQPHDFVVLFVLENKDDFDLEGLGVDCRFLLFLGLHVGEDLGVAEFLGFFLEVVVVEDGGRVGKGNFAPGGVQQLDRTHPLHRVFRLPHRRRLLDPRLVERGVLQVQQPQLVEVVDFRGTSDGYFESQTESHVLEGFGRHRLPLLGELVEETGVQGGTEGAVGRPPTVLFNQVADFRLELEGVVPVHPTVFCLHLKVSDSRSRDN